VAGHYRVGCHWELERMEQLKYLHITMRNGTTKSGLPFILSWAAGRPPRLKEFGFSLKHCSKGDHYNQFLELFGAFYQGSKLTLKFAR